MAKKKICENCGHKCHCNGIGYYVNTDQCDTCECILCLCEPEVLKEKPKKKKSWWQKYVDWLFKEYNDEAM